MSEDWQGDPFADSNDPAAREREERRREREEKRQQRAAKEAEKEAAAPPPPPPQPPAEPPQPPRTPEQEFWDEDPAPELPPEEPRKEEQAPVVTPAPSFDWERHNEGDPEVAAAGNGRGPGGSRGGGVLGALRRHPFLIFAVIAALFVLWFLGALFQPFHGDGSGQVQVTIPRGASVSEVGDLLSEKGVIDDSTLFQVRVTLAGKRSELYAGPHTLAEGMSYGAAIDALSQRPVKRTVTVTIPEGYSRSQAAQLAEEAGVPGSYSKASEKSSFLDPADYGGKGAKSLEGFLFPNTFELKPKAPAADLVELQLKDFKRQIKKVDMSYAKSKNLTVFDVLIIASMIEDEAGVASQRKLVASVIYNRLKEGMPLGIDATTRFYTGNYTEPLTESELNEDSPYNTRENVGLPPGPINSPGLAALQAAAHPGRNDYLFYVTDAGTCGKLAFSSNEDDWVKDVERYERAREEAGGQNPDTCGE